MGDVYSEDVFNNSDSNELDHVSVIGLDSVLEQRKKERRDFAEKLKEKAKKYVPVIETSSGELKSVHDLTHDEIDEEIIKCASDPIYFIETYLTVFDQTSGNGGAIIPFKLFESQKRFIKSCLENDFVITNKYRQGGISTVTTAYIAWYLIAHKNRNIAIVADKLETAKDELMKDVVDFIDSLPKWLAPKTGQTKNRNYKNTQKLKEYSNNSKLAAFSSKGLRGYTPTLLFWDETAWTEKNDKFWTSALPTLQTGGNAILVSCVTKNSYIFTESGIEQVEDYLTKTNLQEKNKYELIDSVNVLGIEKKRETNIIYYNGYVPTIIIDLDYTRLETSYTHKYWAYNEISNITDWVKADKITKNHKVCISKGNNIWGDNKIFKSYISYYLLGLYYFNDSFLGDNHEIVFYINDDLIKSLKLNKVKYKTNNNTIIIKNSQLYNYIKKNDIELNKKALKSSYKSMIYFLKGVFYNKKEKKFNSIQVTNKSKKLIEQIKIILLNFGVLTTGTDNAIFVNGINYKELIELLETKAIHPPKNTSDLVWAPIKNISYNKNYTYDFSMSNNNPIEDNEFHMSIVYNGIVTHQTPNGLDPVFYKTYDSAEKGVGQFKAVSLWWFNDPRYNKELKWIKDKDKETQEIIIDDNFSYDYRIKLYNEKNYYPTSPWFEKQIDNANGDMRKIRQELMCSFLGSDGTFIPTESIKRIEEEDNIPPIRQEYVDNNMWIYEDVDPNEEYLIVLDVSSGHSEDNSTINILKDNDSLEQVAEYYGKLTPNQLGELAYAYGKTYNNGMIIIDVTGGYGSQTLERVFELGYDPNNIYYSEITHKPTRDMLSGYLKRGSKVINNEEIQIDLVPGFFIGSNRGAVLLEFQRTIYLKKIKIRSSRATSELKTFIAISGNRVADHKRSFHDDSIIGLAIACYVKTYSQKNDKKPLDILKNSVIIKRKETTINHRNKYLDQFKWLYD